MINMMSVSHRLEQSSNYGFADGVCLLGAYLHKSQQVSWLANFEAGTQYVIIGAGSDDTRDLDLKVSTEY